MKKLKYFLYGISALMILGIIALCVFYNIKNMETHVMGDEARKNVAGKFIRLSAGITYYEIAGADSAQTIVLVHGFSVPSYIWGKTFDSLVQSGYKVVRYDEFGRGFSDRPDATYDPSLYRRQLHDLINQLNLKTPISIAGLSFGGAVVSDFVVHYPDMIDKVILIDPVYRFENLSIPKSILNYYLAIDPDKQANGQLVDFKYPEQFPNWVSDYKVQMMYKGFRNAIVSTVKNYPMDTIFSNYDKLNSLNKKVLLIWGKEDKTITFNFSDSLRKRLQCDFLSVDDAGHLPHLEKPSLVNGKIVSFLKE